jgi:hypothetical protein
MVLALLWSSIVTWMAVENIRNSTNFRPHPSVRHGHGTRTIP